MKTIAIWWRPNFRCLNAIGNVRVVLLGSGALPLTAILLAKAAPELSIQCVDRDPEACELAFQLMERLHLAEPNRDRSSGCGRL